MNRVFLTVQFVDSLSNQISNFLGFIFTFTLLPSLFYSLGKLLFLDKQCLQVEGTAIVRAYMNE